MFLDPGQIASMLKTLVGCPILAKTGNCLKVLGPRRCVFPGKQGQLISEYAWSRDVAESIICEAIPAFPWTKERSEEIHVGILQTHFSGMLVVRMKNYVDPLVESWVLDVYVNPTGAWNGTFYEDDDEQGNWVEGVDIRMDLYQSLGVLDMQDLLHYCTDSALSACVHRQRIRKSDKLVAFAMATHPRLGDGSNAKVLGRDAISLVVNLLGKEDQIKWKRLGRVCGD